MIAAVLPPLPDRHRAIGRVTPESPAPLSGRKMAPVVSGVGPRSGTVVLLSVVQLGLAAFAFPDSLQLRLSPGKTELLVGEPLVLTVRFNGDAEVKIDDPSKDGPLRIWIDRGGGAAPYVPPRLYGKGLLSDRQPIRIVPGREHVIELVLITEEMGLVLPTPGQYSVVAEYILSDGAAIRSNVVEVVVSPPQGLEREVFDRLSREEWKILSLDEPIPVSGRFAPILSRYPASVYLQNLRLSDLRYRSQGIANEPKPSRNEHRRRLMPLASEVAATGGQFAPDALLILADLHRLSGDQEAGRLILQRIVADHPMRRAAWLARHRLID